MPHSQPKEDSTPGTHSVYSVLTCPCIQGQVKVASGQKVPSRCQGPSSTNQRVPWRRPGLTILTTLCINLGSPVIWPVRVKNSHLSCFWPPEEDTCNPMHPRGKAPARLLLSGQCEWPLHMEPGWRGRQPQSVTQVSSETSVQPVTLVNQTIIQDNEYTGKPLAVGGESTSEI